MKFLEIYADKIKSFSGEIGSFYDFKSIVEGILESYAYYDYLEIKKSFNSNEKIRCSLIIDKIKGDILYIKAKEYIDRNDFGFLSMILIKSAERLMNEILQEKNQFMVLITKNQRYLFIKQTSNIIIIQEFKSLFDFHSIMPLVKEKQVLKTLKTPGKLLFDTNIPFVICDKYGKGLLSNDPIKKMNKIEVPSDLITLFNTSIKIISQIYKDELLLFISFTDLNGYCAMKITNFIALIRLSNQDHIDFKDQTRIFQEIITILETYNENQEKLVFKYFNSILEFVRFFS